MAHNDIKEILEERQELKYKMADVDRKLFDMVNNFDGTLIEALQLGIVRLNFASPPGFKKYIMDLK